MAKPWARLEQNYINHPKFLALNANAICLWHEGKNYCDMHHTDGLIPKEALKTFRFSGPKAQGKLLASCGLKPSGEAYAPLWEGHPVGFKMHDYLVHNDCRDEVLARLQDAEDVAAVRKLANRERQQKARESRKQYLVALQAACDNGVTVTGKPCDSAVTHSVTSRKNERDRTRDTSTPTETETVVETETKKEQKSGGGSKRPIYTSDRFAVFEWQLDELAKVLGSQFDAFDLHAFFDALSQRSRTEGLVIPKAEVWNWLQAQVLAEAKRRKLPIVEAKTATSLHSESAASMAEGVLEILKKQGAM